MSGVWVLARAGEHRYARLEGQQHRACLGEHQKAQRLPPSHLWPDIVRTQLRQCPQDLVRVRVPHVQNNASSTEASLQAWQTSFQDLHCLAVGYVELEVEGSADCTKVLDATTRVSADFWAMTNFCHNPLVLCKARQTLLFQKGVSVHALGATLTWQARNWSFLLTPSSVRTLQRHWASTVHPAEADKGPPQSEVAIFLPVPHALLLLSGLWVSYAFPLLPAPTGPRKTRSWFHLCQHLQKAAAFLPALDLRAGLPGHAEAGQGRRPAQAQVAQLLPQGYSPELLLHLADTLRSVLPTCPPVERARCETTIAELADRRDKMLLQMLERDRHVHSIDLIIESVLLSSMLRSAADLLDVIKAALRVAVPDAGVAARYLRLLEQKHQVPAVTTLRRHRFTLLTGFYRWQASQLALFLKESGNKFIRWATADASPQGGYEWLNQGLSLSVTLTSVQPSFMLLVLFDLTSLPFPRGTHQRHLPLRLQA